MTGETVPAREARLSSAPYVLPFVVFAALLALHHYEVLAVRTELVLRCVVLSAVLAVVSRRVLAFRPSRPVPSILLGVLVFALWIAPDVVFPHYREHWIFQNALLGAVRSRFPQDLQRDPFALAIRCFLSAALVPIVEELFWRGWLMRWLINPRFEIVPPGAWTVGSFFLTAALFASEHGPYWDVGLVAGILYNWWMIRTKCLADCIAAHAVTNLCLSVYVIAAGQWQYWP